MATISEALALALQHHQAGRLQPAEQIYRQVLQVEPNNADANHLLGMLAQRVGRREIALEYIGRAVALNGNVAEFHYNLAKVYDALRRYPEAIASCRRALELKPDLCEAHNNLGVALKEIGKLDEAVACYRRSLELNPDYAEAHNNLGQALLQQRRLDAAAACFRRALALNPDFAEAHNNLGLALTEQGNLEEAAASLQRALTLEPDLAEALNNLGAVLHDLGHLQEAVALYHRALEIEPGYAGARLNLAAALLMIGSYEKGWRLYESRLALLPDRAFSAPRWNHEPAEGKTILLHCEQGFGDTLQFLRFAATLRERTNAARVILECQPKLARLLAQSCRSEMEIISRTIGRPVTDKAPPGFDWHLPLLSLPLALGICAPMQISKPYLRADPALRACWRDRLGPAAGLRIGLAWQGNPAQARDRGRSIPADQFLPFFKTKGATFYSLQLDAGAAVLPTLTATGLIDLTEHINDFADTAALMAELDLVITVDSAVAHLAGALGRPVWTLLRFIPHWPYGLQGESTPWYPTMRLFRQSRRGDWNAVMHQVSEALDVFAWTLRPPRAT